MLSNCPRCHASFEHVVGDSAICGCGWTGSLSNKKPSRFGFARKNKSAMGFKKKRMSSKTMMNMGFIALSLAGFSYGYSEWKSNVFARSFYIAKSMVKLNSSADEFNMAVICHKLGKLDCKVSALTNAYKKDSNNVQLIGEYAIALTESKQYDAAILAFQKFFSMSEGNARTKFYFAKSLGEKEFYTDAKEYYYKAIQENPENLEIAESLMAMLTKANMYGEAMSVIGHFNMTIPRTQKIWHNLTLKIKGQYKDYQTQFAIKEMTISKLGNYFFAPAVFTGAMDMQLFIVNPEAVYTTVDMTYLKNNAIKFEDKGKIEVHATNGNGQTISGTKIVIPELLFGAWTLKNVVAVACDNCAFVAGKSILGQLSVQTSQVANTHVNLLSMKEK
jgi:tetratricopeptide (TPR) repeat protein